MAEHTLLPLEQIFKQKSERLSEFPYRDENYFGTYVRIVEHLKNKIYPLVDIGLAALSKVSGFYTLHNAEHFDEVVKYAGLLLGCEHGEETLDLLSAYELYVLLLAIRLHDAGNMYGREDHEKKVFHILKQMGELASSNDFERKFIADIAEAHGGRTPDGSKDTISRLKPQERYGCIEIRPQLLAAIVRFADEICESRPRAALKLLNDNALPKHSEVFHKYASVIQSVIVKRDKKRVELQFDFSLKDALAKWGKGAEDNVQEVFLMNEILERLEKMFLERQYCGRFMREVCNIESVRADITIYKAGEGEEYNNQYHPVKKIMISDDEEGYPESICPLKEKYDNVSGEALYAELMKMTGGEASS